MSVSVRSRPCKIAPGSASTNAFARPLDAIGALRTVAIWHCTLDAKAALAQMVMPRVVQRVPFMNDAVAAKRFCQIKRLVGGRINGLLAAPGQKIGNTGRNSDRYVAAVGSDRPSGNLRLYRFDLLQPFFDVTA
jgi:hypothetical protein